MKGTILVSQSCGWNPQDGLQLLVIRIPFKLHKYLGERGIQWSPLVVFEIFLYFLIVPGVVILYCLGFLLFLGLLERGLWLLPKRIEKGSECLLLVNVPIYLYHKSVEILRWFQHQVYHQWPILF
jgi:hypothetical protein